MKLNGLHHVTAVTGRAADNMAFYTRVLGMRLVKKTVNQDDLSAYHFYYADSVGHPGTTLTFFDWPQLAPAAPGSGTIGRIGLRVPAGTLDWWAQHLAACQVEAEPLLEWAGHRRLRFLDPEGLPLELVDDGGAPASAVPWVHSPLPQDKALRGLHAITLVLADPGPSVHVLTHVMGLLPRGVFALPGEPERRALLFGGPAAGPETAAEGAGSFVYVEERPGLVPGRVGPGGVHHAAFRTPDGAEQRAWRGRLAHVGLHVTPVIDRYYFRSIYYREPGGVLLEIATDGPGFVLDEDAEHLGERLSLPPFLERQRARIEAGLRPL